MKGTMSTPAVVSPNTQPAIGSIWRKWDLHVHTPGTVLEDQFTSWTGFLAALRAEKEVAVMGVTDYMSISNYEKLVAEQSLAPLGSIVTLIPNIEFRVAPQTAKGHAINLHLLIDPTSPAHIVEIHAALARLSIRYQAVPYSCTRSDLIRLGAAFDHALTDEIAKLEAGTNQFKIDFSAFASWYSAEGWLNKHSLVAVAAGNDGPSGLKDGGWVAAKQSVYAFSKIIFSASANDRAFWLCEDKDKAAGATKMGAPKPCVSSSDAHCMEKLFKPDLDRFCWIKADPTFEGLRSILYEPSERVHVGKFPPSQHDASRVIKRIAFGGTSPSNFGGLNIECNKGLVAIIGSKGSGKSALADLAAYAAGISFSPDDKSSFLMRAKDFIRGLSVTIHWADGNSSSAVIGNKVPGKPLVRYLSQSFVERLCSDDYAGLDLTHEIENVIFGHLDPTDTLNASSFKDLRELRTKGPSEERQLIDQKIKSCIAEDEKLRAILKEVPTKVARIQQLSQENEALQKQIPPAQSEAEAQAQVLLVSLRERLLKLQATVGQAKQNLLAIDQLIGSLSRFRKIFEEFKAGFITEAKRLGIETEKLEIELTVGGEGEISGRRAELDALIERFEHGSDESVPSIDRVNVQIGDAEKKVAADAATRNQIQQLQKKISLNSQELQRLQAENVHAEGPVKTRLAALRNERLDFYQNLFDSWKEEQVILEKLYRPVQQKLSVGDSEEQKLDFYIRWKVDLDGWLDRGNALFDQRKGHPFMSQVKFREVIEKLLVPGWQSGNPASVRQGMDQLLTEFKEKNISSFLKSSATHAGLLEWVFDYRHIDLSYGLRYNKTELENLSPGTKGIVLLVLYLAMDEEDNRPLIVDQPEENLDSESIYLMLSKYFRAAKKRRQVILITHNPNLVVNTDAEQIIIASSSRGAGTFPTFEYCGGSLEDSAGVREKVCNILEGGERAFLEREKRYALQDKRTN
jgi:energy-coupling factor transporter ATP-binding protein EcfA2